MVLPARPRYEVVRMARSKQRLRVDDAQQSLRQGLPGLAELRMALPAASADPGGRGVAPSPDPGQAPPRTSIYGRGPKLVVRRERKGHGGKTVTRLEGVIGSTREREQAVREIKRALGCGAVLEGSDVVVQGDQSERLVAFLEQHGARRVIVGN